MLGMFKDEALEWYMNLPRASVSGYLDQVWKMNKYFPILKQGEASISTPLNNRLGLDGHVRKYRDSFNEWTMRIARASHENAQFGGLNGLSVKMQNTIAKESIDLFCYSVL